jgi:8-oxo-dGTP pyrophosphatase MutT (NUDIX family)
VAESKPRKIRAAGGVVWRLRSAKQAPGEPGPPSSLADMEFALVHRPRYQDWSLPKGKAKKRESSQQAALREVREETGLECELGEELRTVQYLTPKGEEKTVRWWAMTVLRDHGFEPNQEVDQISWVVFEELSKICAFFSDLEVVHSLSIYEREI